MDRRFICAGASKGQKEKITAIKDFKKYYSLPAPPEQVYATLTNAPTIQLWTGEPAVMSDAPGEEFSLWGDSITGRNIEFIKDKKIVQQWYFGDRPEQSIVTIILHRDKGGTSMEVRHTNIPDEDYDEITDGWTDNYIASLLDFFD